MVREGSSDLVFYVSDEKLHPFRSGEGLAVPFSVDECEFDVKLVGHCCDTGKEKTNASQRTISIRPVSRES